MPDQIVATVLPKTPISLRLTGELATAVSKRYLHPAVTSPGAVVRRDLGRYYAACRAALKRLRFDYAEARILVSLLSRTQFDAASMRYLWAELDENLKKSPKQFPPDSEDYARAEHLIAELRACSPIDAVAILDAVEIYWAYRMANDERADDFADEHDAIAASGLTEELIDSPREEDE